MSIPTLTTNIIQPQNIILNHVPLTTVLPTLNTVGVPIVTTLAPATAMEQGGEIKTGFVVETIPIAGPVGIISQVQQVKQPLGTPQPGTSTANAPDHNEARTVFCLKRRNRNLQRKEKQLLPIFSCLCTGWSKLDTL